MTDESTCLTWLKDEQKVHDTSEYGENYQSVQEALTTQDTRTRLVQEYSREVDKHTRNKQDEDSEHIQKLYDILTVTSSKRLSCLNDIAKIADLENSFGALSVELAKTASDLVDRDALAQGTAEDSDEQGAHGQSQASTVGAQNCILAVRKNWSWISKLVRCTEIHLQFVREYHQFFHDIHEYSHWMPKELSDIQTKVSHKLINKGDRQDAGRLLLDLKEVLAFFMHWQQKINSAFTRSKSILPIHLRTQKIDYFRPVSAICDYKTKEFDVREKEELVLIDNSNPQQWVLRNMYNKELTLPSVVCLIPGPDPVAVDVAVNLQLRLLGVWTSNVKRIGKTIIAFLMLVVNDINDKQKRSLCNLNDKEKDTLLTTGVKVISQLSPQWKDYDGFVVLQELMKRFATDVTADGNPGDKDGAFNKSTLDKFGTVNELLTAYQDYWINYQTYKVLTETSRQNDLVLLIEKWQQLQYIDRDQLQRHWNNSLEFNDDEQSEWKSFWDQVMSKVDESVLESARTRSGGDGAGSGVGGSGSGVGGSGSGVGGSGSGVGGSGGESLFTKLTADTVTSGYGSGAVNGSGLGGYGQGGLTGYSISSRGGLDGSDGSGGYTTTTRTTRTTTSYGGADSGAASRTTLMSQSGTLGNDGIDAFDSVSDVITAETVEQVESSRVGAAPGGYADESSVHTHLETKETAATDQFTKIEQEEKKTFVITGVINPRNGEEVSMQEAIRLGIIDNTNGTYVLNSITRESIPIPIAMNQGHIKVEFTTTKRTAEKRQDVGLITITIEKESRPYTVKAVIDASSDDQLSVEEAVAKDILDQKNGTYRNTLNDSIMTLGEALDSGLLVVEFDKSASVDAPEVITRTYAIHSVVDQRAKAKIKFADAIKKGLINKSTGAYYHNVNSEDIYVGDAIRKGFIKATVVKDPSTLDIDPENRMVIDKVDAIKKKLLNPLKAMAAMKRAANGE